ncbi:MAG: tryptophan--tRNA ligase [Nanobdellota archaeon]
MQKTFNPWDVNGDVNYDELMEKFGLKYIKKCPEVLEDNLLFRRKKIFAHRDFKQIVDCIEEKKPFILMTGLMPTGNFHIGHMILAQQFIHYQKLGAKLYIAVADIEAYNARGQSLEESRKIAIEQYIKNYIALGLKPENCEIYFQSSRSKDSEKSNKYYQLQNLLANHATFNEFRAVYGEITPGKMLSALLQAADMLHPQIFEGKIPVLVPVGIDQDPHLRLARDISKRYKGFDFLQLSSTYHVFVPGLGGGKMSSSDPSSFIALTDDAKTVKKKVNKYAFSGGQPTLEEHRKKGGNPDTDVSYQWLTFFEEDDEKLKKIYEDYKKGVLLSGELKAILIDKINGILKDVQSKRNVSDDVLKKYIDL